MKFYFSILIVALLSAFFNEVHAQNIIENQILVNFKQKINDEDLKSLLNRNFAITGEMIITDICTEPVIIKKIEFDDRNKDISKITDFLNNTNFAVFAQFNHFVEGRNTPNDSLFIQQWHLNNTGQGGGVPDADIDADLAWDLTTGGTTKKGDTIVICVVDNGLDLSHEDIIDNLWINHREIPDNGIDDDQNSYIDDYNGWNGEDQNGSIPFGNHGTSVAGLIGGRGNNKKGISGINWNIKIMPAYKGNEEAHMLSAYAYAYTLRKQYNESNGTKGAFIVATNSSFGTDYAMAKDHPIWCSMYDSLGSVGILNIVATANNNTNVDIQGDMPSTCPGDFMISVTNIDQYNNKVNGAGYGPVNIDIGGYGANVLTIRTNNRYTSFNGTSAATPVVSGVVGLIYAHSERIAEIALTNPSRAALMAKDAILEGSKPLNSLKNITVTGGVVNAFNSLNSIGKYDRDCAPPYLINVDTVGADIISLSWENTGSGTYNLAYKTENKDWEIIENITSPYTLQNLGYCSDVELKMQNKCGDTLSPFGYTLKVNTLGCCTSPEINEHYIKDQKIHFSWNEVFAAQNYHFIYKYWSDPLWDTVITENNYIDIDYKIDCGKLSAYLKSECGDTLSGETLYKVYGQDCPECISHQYCYPVIDNDFEWITKIKINDFENISGKNSDGIGIYSNSPAIKLIQNETYSLKAYIDFSGLAYSDSLFVWIDADNNGIFQPEELICRGSNNKTNEVNVEFTVPELYYTGNSRMRVLLSAYSISDPCDIGNNDYGEYEDYCIVLDTANHCKISDLNVAYSKIDPDNIQLKWNKTGQGHKYLVKLRIKNSGEEFYPIAFTADTSLIVKGLDTCTFYEVNIGVYCSPLDIAYNEIYTFKTQCSNATEEIDLSEFTVYPNPASYELNIYSDEGNRNYNLKISDIYGRIVYNKKDGQGNISLNDLNLQSGIFFLSIDSGDKKYNYKVVICNE
jgi:serine protease